LHAACVGLMGTPEQMLCKGERGSGMRSACTGLISLTQVLLTAVACCAPLLVSCLYPAG
jgi:hypothetical protein